MNITKRSAMLFRALSSLPSHPPRFAITLALLAIALFVAAWLAWCAFSRGALSRACCPHCGSERIRPSLFRQADDWFLRWLFLSPFRCETCGLRHFNVRWALRSSARSLPSAAPEDPRSL